VLNCLPADACIRINLGLILDRQTCSVRVPEVPASAVIPQRHHRPGPHQVPSPGPRSFGGIFAALGGGTGTVGGMRCLGEPLQLPWRSADSACPPPATPRGPAHLGSSWRLGAVPGAPHGAIWRHPVQHWKRAQTADKAPCVTRPALPCPRPQAYNPHLTSPHLTSPHLTSPLLASI